MEENKPDLRIDNANTQSHIKGFGAKWLRRIAPILIILAGTSFLAPHVIQRLVPIPPADTVVQQLTEPLRETVTVVLMMVEARYTDIGHALLIIAALLHAYLLYRESREELKHRSFRKTLTGIWCTIAVLTATGLTLHNVGFVTPSGLEVHAQAQVAERLT